MNDMKLGQKKTPKLQKPLKDTPLFKVEHTPLDMKILRMLRDHTLKTKKMLDPKSLILVKQKKIDEIVRTSFNNLHRESSK